MGELTKLENGASTVSITPHAEGLRLRWRIGSKRPELYIPSSRQDADRTAAALKTIIEQDLLTGAYDSTLNRYKEILQKAAQVNLVTQRLTAAATSGATLRHGRTSGLFQEGSLVTVFNHYLTAKSLDPEAIELSSYYTQTRSMLKRWGTFEVSTVPALLGKEQFGPKTFNDRRNCLVKFFSWLVRKGWLKENPLADVATKTRKRNAEARKPFTDSEVTALLEALRSDRFRKKSARYSHAQYYPLVAFMIQTGVRNAEAIGLQVRDILWETGEIRICRALARTSEGTNAGARKEKGTKTNNIRYLPMNKFLQGLLAPLCIGKEGAALVFTNELGNMIDDRMFQRRVFKPVQRALGIQVRDLYSCRHTLATRAVQAGMKAHEVAYLMGDNLQTVLANYYHSERVTVALPELTKGVVSATEP